jgi:uncharacterized protein YceK
MRMWLAMLAVAVVLTGCGVFFALQDLGTANGYASIASFFLALLTASGSVISRIRSKPKDRTDSGSNETPGATLSGPVNVAFDNILVQQGPNASAKIKKIVDQRPERKVRRRP